MAFKAILLCSSALLVQSISGQFIQSYGQPSCGCTSGLSSGFSSGFSSSYSPIISSGFSSGISGNSAAVSNGRDFIVTSIGPISPSGIAVSSDVALAGDLDVCGAMPFLSAVVFDTTVPTSGSGCVDYGCGCSSNVGITSVSGRSGSLGGCSCLG